MIEATLTRQDVRIAVRQARQGYCSITQCCLLAQMANRVTKKRWSVGNAGMWENRPLSPILPINGPVRTLISEFDQRYQKANIDRLYKEFKKKFPGKVVLTY